jgi:hypothetical protein
MRAGPGTTTAATLGRGSRPCPWGGGGGGNRTRVRRRTPRASPGAACLRFSRPQRSHRHVAAGLSRLEVPTIPTTRMVSSGSLVDASYRAESTPGLTDLVTRSGGECEVGALGIGTYWFTAVVVNELTPSPRPASPGSTSDVETCHPHVELSCCCGLSAAPRGYPVQPHPRTGHSPVRPSGRPCPGRAPPPPGPGRSGPPRAGHRTAGPVTPRAGCDATWRAAPRGRPASHGARAACRTPSSLERARSRPSPCRSRSTAAGGRA